MRKRSFCQIWVDHNCSSDKVLKQFGTKREHKKKRLLPIENDWKMSYVANFCSFFSPVKVWPFERRVALVVCFAVCSRSRRRREEGGSWTLADDDPTFPLFCPQTRPSQSPHRSQPDTTNQRYKCQQQEESRGNYSKS